MSRRISTILTAAVISMIFATPSLARRAPAHVAPYPTQVDERYPVSETRPSYSVQELRSSKVRAKARRGRHVDPVQTRQAWGGGGSLVSTARSYIGSGNPTHRRTLGCAAFMNLVMESAEELNDGELKAKLGTILLRGGNIIFV